MFLFSLNFVTTCTATLWYFADKNAKYKGYCMQSFNWMLFKHFGSVALSSLLLAIMWVAQLLMKVLIAMLKDDDAAGENTCAICIAKIFSCCLDCFERCISFISKQAYCEIAIRSCSYCEGACKSMALA